MNDFSTRLTAMLDDVAAGINPRPDFDAVGAAGLPVVANGPGMAERFRRPLLAAAAATLVVAGGVAAYQVLERDGLSGAADGDWPGYPAFDDRPPNWPDDPVPPAPAVAVPAIELADDPKSVDTTAPSTTEPEVVESTAVLGALLTDGDRVTQQMYGTAPDGTSVVATGDFGPPTVALAADGVWKLTIDLSRAERGRTYRIEVTVGDAEPFVFEVTTPKPAEPKPTVPATTLPKVEPVPETTVAPKPQPAPSTTVAPKPQPKPEPKPEPEPAPVPFTAKAVDPYQDETYLKHSFYGTAPAGAKIVARSDWGSVDSVANEKGHWEMRLKLKGVPDKTVVVVTVTASTGGSASFELVRHAPQPVRKDFTSNLGDVYDNADYFKPVLFGTGTAGSKVTASSEYGSASTTVGSDGYWEIWFKMFEVPNGPVGVRVANNASEAVYEYNLNRRNAWEPKAVEFTATAACGECESAFNAFWGTAPAGSVITVSSPFGGGQVVVGESGGWEIGVEFPGAPVGEKFWITITNSEAPGTCEKPMKILETL